MRITIIVTIYNTGLSICHGSLFQEKGLARQRRMAQGQDRSTTQSIVNDAHHYATCTSLQAAP